MSNISMVEARLPPGFRFHPRDDELVCDYLMRKVSNSDSDSEPPLLIVVDLNKCEPWDIPEVASVGGKEWYFYSQRDRKYATGLRTNRATASGYWKATGKDRTVLRKGTLVGMRKTLVFYLGRAPRGRKTDWVMHEFRIEGPPPSLLNEDWVLCRVFHKSRDVLAGVDATSDGFEGFCHDSSQSLPNSFIGFGQSNPANAYEQVPCFSILSQSQSQFSPTFIGQGEPCNVTEGNDISTYGMFGDWDDSSCHKKEVLKAVMNRIAKAEIIGAEFSLSPSLEGSSESYLSEVVMPNIWNN